MTKVWAPNNPDFYIRVFYVNGKHWKTEKVDWKDIKNKSIINYAFSIIPPIGDNRLLDPDFAKKAFMKRVTFELNEEGIFILNDPEVYFGEDNKLYLKEKS